MSGTGPQNRSIAIFGAAASVWPVAALLSKELPQNWSLTVVIDEDDDALDTGFAIPLAHPFLTRLGIGAKDFLKFGGSISLGTDMRGWLGDGSSHFHAGAGTLPSASGVPLHLVMLRAARMHDQESQYAHLFAPFRLPARAGIEGKCSLASKDGNSPLAMLGPQAQMSDTAFAALLQNLTTPERVAALSGRPVEVTQSEAKALSSVRLDCGTAIDADLFIDMSGAMSQLAELPRMKAFSLEPLKRFTTISARSRSLAPNDPVHPVASALGDGMRMDTPTSDSMIECFVGAEPVEGWSSNTFEPGIVAEPWSGNCIRMAHAAGSIGPQFSADMALLLDQALLLAEYFPATADQSIEAQAFNAAHNQIASQLAQMPLAAILLNRRPEAFWRDEAKAHSHEELSIRLAQFASRGRLATFEKERHDRQSWIDFMIGFGAIPEKLGPQAEALDMQRLLPTLRNLASDFNIAIANMPDHAEFMRSMDST